MKLTFMGAAHEVTGSCFLLDACGKHIMIDCGMEQGPDLYENQPLPLAPGEVDALLLTHAHIDHSGRIPLLVKQGFSGPVYTTTATAELCSIMLRDSAHIQEFEAEWRNRKAQRSGGEEYVPLYTVQDAEQAMKLFQPCSYGKAIQLYPGIEIRFTDAGHLLGSASIEIRVTENDRAETILFSGDIGNTNQPLIRDPNYLQQADYVIMESTYGDRSHGPRPDYVHSLAAILQDTFDRGGNVVIPSFAVGRTQEMLYFLRQIKEEHLVKGHDNFPVYVDSPLANEATNIFQANIWECCDQETMGLLQNGVNPIRFPGLMTSVTSDDSKAINFDNQCKVILSASGMCEAGRIRHHLKHNLWRPESTILFVGYQAVGTLGRALVEGAPKVKLFGEDIEVRAKIQKLEGLSGHADHDGLVKWLKHIERKPKKVFVVHGNDEVCDKFVAELQQMGYDAAAPYNGGEYDLDTGVWVEAGNQVRMRPKTSQQDGRRLSSVYQRLLNAGKRLMAVIARNEGGANKDLARFADQVNSLCDKWDR